MPVPSLKPSVRGWVKKGWWNWQGHELQRGHGSISHISMRCISVPPSQGSSLRDGLLRATRTKWLRAGWDVELSERTWKKGPAKSPELLCLLSGLKKKKKRSLKLKVSRKSTLGLVFLNNKTSHNSTNATAAFGHGRCLFAHSVPNTWSLRKLH